MRRPAFPLLPYLMFFGAAAVALLSRVGASVFMGPPDTLESKWLDTPNGWTLHYVRAGDPAAPRIVYIHGSPGDIGAWSDYLNDPIPAFESIAYDRPGFGPAEPHEAIASLEQQALALEPFLVERQGRWPILVGHSLGAPIAVQAAIDFPGRVGGLVLISGCFDPSLEYLHWYQYFAEAGVMPLLLPEPIRASNRELWPLKQELLELAARLTELDCPVSIVHAEDDRLVSYGNVAYMEAHFPADTISGRVLLDDGDHFLPWNREHIVRNCIVDLADASSN